MPMVHTLVYDTIKRGISLTAKGKGEQQAEKWKNTWLAGILLFLMSPELRISTGNSVSRSHLFSLWYLWVCDVTSIYANGFYLHSSVFLAKILLRSHFFNFKESQVQWKINTAHSSPHPKCGCGRVCSVDKSSNSGVMIHFVPIYQPKQLSGAIFWARDQWSNWCHNTGLNVNEKLGVNTVI